MLMKVNETKEKWITFHFGEKYDKYNKIRGYFKKKLQLNSVISHNKIYLYLSGNAQKFKDEVRIFGYASIPINLNFSM